MLIFGLCCFAGWNIRILERGLQEFEALFMVAVFTASQIVAGFVVCAMCTIQHSVLVHLTTA